MSAADPDKPEGDADPLAASLAEELRRRGLEGDGAAEEAAAEEANPVTELLNKARGGAPGLRSMGGPPEWTAPPKEKMDAQLERSRRLNSEGLEGFPTRAAELLKLGGSFFLAFGPFIGGVVLLFALTYFVLGADFIHGGSDYQEPFVSPEELLGAPTVDPMVPFSKYAEPDVMS